MWLADWEPQFLQEDKAGQKLQALMPYLEIIVAYPSDLASAISPIVFGWDWVLRRRPKDR